MINLSTIEKQLQTELKRFVHSSHPLLGEAASHTLLNPGKRLRPLLTLYTVISLGGKVEAALVPACALEILHTYSLVHDDLPSMDDDDFRRGKPTLHKIYNEGQAILVGDLLLTLTFEVLSSAPLLSAEQKVELIQILSKRAGGQGMILGQSLDLAYEGKDISWEQLCELHQKKTGDLISASLEFGGVVAGASSQTKESLAAVGQKIGLAFQIVDDLLELKEGTLSSDIHKQKSTSLSLLGAEKAKEVADHLLAEALLLCKKMGLTGSCLEKFLPQLVFRSV